MTTTTPTRVALGLAALAADQMRVNARGGEFLATTVGLLGESGHAVRVAAGRIAAPSTRAATIAARRAARMPGASRVREPAQRALDWVRNSAASARERGRETMAASRADAAAIVASTVDDGLSWLVPRVLERALPEVRGRLVPVVVEQVTADPRLRQFLTEQTRVLVEGAMDQLSGKPTALAR